MGGIATRRGWSIAILVAVIVVGLGRWSGARAQEAVPGTEAVTPDPALCQVSPRTIDGLKALFIGATPAAEQPATEVTVPIGHPADAATAAGVVRTVEEAVACLNAGDFLRFLALMTDDAVL